MGIFNTFVRDTLTVYFSRSDLDYQLSSPQMCSLKNYTYTCTLSQHNTLNYSLKFHIHVENV